VPDYRGIDRQSCFRHTVGASPELRLYPVHSGAISDQVVSCADSMVTSPPSALNEVLAFEVSSPSTSAETVATTAMDTETRFFVSSDR
jgi:hypothetical protein